MSTDSKTTPVIKREEFTYPATEKGTLVLSVGLQRQIEWLHKMVGAKEWCGVLFYKRLEGDIDNPKDLKLYASEIYLMDIGRETYTEADFDGNAAVEMWDMVNDDYTFKRGLIHTHHNMTTFFSGTDMSELHDNVGTHNYYLSLIVNFSGVYTAKVAFTAKRRIQMEYKNVTDENKEFVTEKDLLMMIDMNIVKEQEEVAVPDFFAPGLRHLKPKLRKELLHNLEAIPPLPAPTVETVRQATPRRAKTTMTGTDYTALTQTLLQRVEGVPSLLQRRAAQLLPQKAIYRGVPRSFVLPRR
jgi:hypothetical protein